MEALAAIGSGAKEAIPALVKTLSEPGWALDGTPQGYATQALVKIGESSIPALLSAAASDWTEVRESAACALGSFSRMPDVTRALIAMLGDAEPEVRAAGAVGLGKIGKNSVEALREPVVAALKPLLEDPDPEVRLSSSNALRSLGTEASLFLPILTTLLNDPDPERRLRACDAIGEIGPAAAPAVRALFRVLKDEDRGVVETAAMALGKIGRGARAALPALREVLETFREYPE